MFKKLVSLLLVAVLCLGAVPAVAAETEPPVAMEESLDVSGETSFGSMVAAEIEDELVAQQENNGYRIFEVTVEDVIATVQLEAVEDCTLVVGLYTEDGTELLVSGWEEITAGDSEAVVRLETAEVPDYFFLKAFLVGESMEPLCPAYSTPHYTQEMQEFFAKTAEDFDADRVLNLDDDPTTNFAVFGEDVVRLETVTNLTVNGDTYIFENANDTVKGLAAGDAFACDHNGETLIVVIATAEVAGDTVTLTAAEAELEDVFDYVRLEGEAGLTETSVGEVNCPEGVTFEGLENSAARSLDASGEAGFSAKFTLAEAKVGNDTANAKVSGSLNFSVKGAIKLYITESYSSLEVKIDYSVKLALTFSGEVNLFKLPLGVPITVPPVPGLYIEFTPSFVGKVSGKVEFGGTLKGTLGFAVNTDEGMTNLSSTPSFEAETTGEFTVFVGISLEPRVVLVSKLLADAGMEATFGVEVKGKMSSKTAADEHHDCNTCLDGDISAKLTVEFSAKLLNNKKWSFKLSLPEIAVKIGDFFWSVTHQDGGWGTCPYISYKVEATVLNADGSKATNAEVTFESGSTSVQATCKKGVATAYLPNGTYWVTAALGEEFGKQSGLKVADKDRKVTVQLTHREIPELNEEYFAQLRLEGATFSVGGSHTALVTENGDLYMWGSNSSGQLGIGVNAEGEPKRSCLPVKVMSNVASVSLGSGFSAAITKDGELYMWGAGNHGRLGNGSEKAVYTPQFIMGNVKSVSLGDGVTAAITKDGDLYMWGSNSGGTVGDFAEERVLTPQFIMHNVKAVDVFGAVAALKENGNLYTWGWNLYGALGSGTTENSNTPQLIMSDVAAVSVGSDHMGAVTTKGELYMWGGNEYSQLGDATRENVLTPKKIMDGVKEVELGDGCTMVIKLDGTLHSWGWAGGALGRTEGKWYEPGPVLDNVKAVSMSGVSWHGAAITEDGEFYTWGNNDYGQLGDGTREYSSLPIRIKLYVPGQETALQVGRSVATVQAANGAVQTATFSDLTPGELYNFYVMRDKEATYPLETENLLYINQGVAADDGTLTFRYVAEGGEQVLVGESAPAEPSGVLGDVDGDGGITSTDARMTLQFYAGKIDESKLNTALADVDGDGSITSTDARLILQYYAGKIDKFPAE